MKDEISLRNLEVVDEILLVGILKSPRMMEGISEEKKSESHAVKFTRKRDDDPGDR